MLLWLDSFQQHPSEQKLFQCFALPDEQRSPPARRDEAKFLRLQSIFLRYFAIFFQKLKAYGTDHTVLEKHLQFTYYFSLLQLRSCGHSLYLLCPHELFYI